MLKVKVLKVKHMNSSTNTASKIKLDLRDVRLLQCSSIDTLSPYLILSTISPLISQVSFCKINSRRQFFKIIQLKSVLKLSKKSKLLWRSIFTWYKRWNVYGLHWSQNVVGFEKLASKYAIGERFSNEMFAGEKTATVSS